MLRTFQMPLVLLFYTAYISVDLAHHEIIRAKVGRAGINVASNFYLQGILLSTKSRGYWNIKKSKN